jgi:hypothetical protein
MSEDDAERTTGPDEDGESIDDTGRNPTQRRMDAEGESESEAPVDEPWVTREGGRE